MAKFPHVREGREGRSCYGDFMDDDLNEQIYDLLIEASEKLEAVIDIEEPYGEAGDGQSQFNIGYYRAAQGLIEDQIDSDYPPMEALWQRRMGKRLLRGIAKTEKDEPVSGQ